MLSITNFSKKYPGTIDPVLSIERCILNAGIYWVKGENGSGKTSLLKSIAGLTSFEGDIKVAGLNIRSNRMGYTRQVNYAEAEPQYPPFLTGKDLIDFYKATKGGEFPATLFSNFGVDKYMHQKTSTYSSGMLKKLSLVLAFTGNPALVLLDEPLIALDLSAVEVLHAAIRQYHQAGVSFIITSHQLFNSELISSTTGIVLMEKTLKIETA